MPATPWLQRRRVDLTVCRSNAGRGTGQLSGCGVQAAEICQSLEHRRRIGLELFKLDLLIIRGISEPLAGDEIGLNKLPAVIEVRQIGRARFFPTPLRTKVEPRPEPKSFRIEAIAKDPSEIAADICPQVGNAIQLSFRCLDPFQEWLGIIPGRSDSSQIVLV